MKHGSNVLVWSILTTLVIVPLALALNSPLLQWRDPVYVVAGFAGVIALALLLLQPLLASGYLPGLGISLRSRIHQLVGIALVLTVIIHVAGLWVTSPPDMIDALLLRSPTSFSIWGVVAMWAIFTTAALAAARRTLKIAPVVWRAAHRVLAMVIVLASAVHALLIEGTMEFFSKVGLCAGVLIATISVVTKLFYRDKTA